jgi:2-dehydropantoate 2-reductase
MNILVFGAGPIGSLYAAKLQEAGNEVSILARGGRLAALHERGIILEDGSTGQRSTTRVRIVESLDSADSYDLVMVIMAGHNIPAVLPQLAASDSVANILFMFNNVDGPGMMVDALRADRVLIGFPGAAGYPKGEAIRYVILSRREQPTTLGEVHGRTTPRLRSIAGTLEEAGFPSALSPNIDAWLKTHAAEIVPTAGALYMEDCRIERLAGSDRAIEMMIRAIRENYRVLKARGIPVTPRNHSVFEWLPVFLLRGIVKKQLGDDLMEIKVGHARSAAKEWKLLADGLRKLAGGRCETPFMDELYRHIVEAAGG